MKNLFISVVVTGIFSTASVDAKAQTNVNIEKLNQKQSGKTSLKFIEGIEFAPEVSSGTSSASETITVNTTPAKAEKVIENKTASSNTSAISIEKCEAWQFKYATMLDMEVESLTNDKLYSFIDYWWATRYRYGGTSSAGIDCSAFTGKLLKEVYNINVPRTARDQYTATNRIIFRDHLREGDLVFFNTRGGVSHVGVYLGNSYFIHSSVSEGVTISSLNESYYDKKFISGGRLYSPDTDTQFNLEEGN